MSDFRSFLKTDTEWPALVDGLSYVPSTKSVFTFHLLSVFHSFSSCILSFVLVLLDFYSHSSELFRDQRQTNLFSLLC